MHMIPLSAISDSNTKTLKSRVDPNPAPLASNDKQLHWINRKKLEKLKTKLAEFFLFSSSESSVAPVPLIMTNNLPNTTINNRTSNPGPKSDHNIDTSASFSNVYYGYKTPHTLSISRLSDANSVASNNSSTGQSRSISELDVGVSCDGDDDELQHNLFDRDFMLEYIQSHVVQSLKKSPLLHALALDLRLPADFNLLREIADDIYEQAESEPCGLNGCKLSIELALNESLNKQIEKVYAANGECVAASPRHLPLTRTLSQFRFDYSSSVTTFELRLVLKEDLSSSTWLRRLLPKSKLFDRLRMQSAIHLEASYDLIKRKLY